MSRSEGDSLVRGALRVCEFAALEAAGCARACEEYVSGVCVVACVASTPRLDVNIPTWCVVGHDASWCVVVLLTYKISILIFLYRTYMHML